MIESEVENIKKGYLHDIAKQTWDGADTRPRFWHKGQDEGKHRL